MIGAVELSEEAMIIVGDVGGGLGGVEAAGDPVGGFGGADDEAIAVAVEGDGFGVFLFVAADVGDVG